MPPSLIADRYHVLRELGRGGMGVVYQVLRKDTGEQHALKVLLTFTLLHRRRLAVADLPAYVERVGFFRDVNAAILRLPAPALAALLVDELARGRAVRVEAGDLVPA